MTELEHKATNSKNTLTLCKLNKTYVWDKVGPRTKHVRPQIRKGELIQLIAAYPCLVVVEERIGAV